MERREIQQKAHEDSVIERTALEWALDQLEPELRDVIDLYYFRELKLRETAETLHISLPLVKYRLRRAKGRLQCYARKGETGS